LGVLIAETLDPALDRRTNVEEEGGVWAS
jgi:hypothetical protein